MTFSVVRRSLLGFASLLLVWLVSGCTSAPVQESAEARSAAYFDALFEVLQDKDQREEAYLRRHKEFDPRMASVTGSDRQDFVNSYLDQALSPFIRDLGATKSEIASLTAPENLAQFHESLLLGMTKKIELVEDVRHSLQSNDLTKLTAAIDKEEVINSEFNEKLQSGLRSAGFASAEDVDRVLNTPKTAMAWYWALLLMILATVVGIWFLSFIIGFVSLGLTPLILLVSKLDEDGKTLLSRIGVSIVYAAIAFVLSMIGASVAGFAETFMYPRTELAPWFVYLVMGWVAAGLAAGSNDETDPTVKLGNCGLALVCLGTYIWAAVAKGSLVGPWLWANQVLLNWLSN